MSIHHVNIIHGSDANSSNSKRVGFAIRFIAPKVRQAGKKYPVILARGRDEYGYYQLSQGPPPGRSIDEAIALHRKAVREYVEAFGRKETDSLAHPQQ
jgi:hypothetical protein